MGIYYRLAATAAGGGPVNTINADASAAQTLTVGTSGVDFAIADNGAGDHKFNLPDATAAHRGALTSADWTAFNAKVGGSGAAGRVTFWTAASTVSSDTALLWDNTTKQLQVGTIAPLISSKFAVTEVSTLTAATTRNITEGDLYLNAAADSATQFSGSQWVVSNAAQTDGKTYSGVITGASGTVALSLAGTTFSSTVTGAAGMVSTSTGGTYATLRGLSGSASAFAGTITTLDGTSGVLTVTGATVTTANVLHARPIAGVLAGSITTANGLLVEPPGSGTTQWTANIGSGNSKIEGSVKIGTTTAPNSNLDFVGSLSNGVTLVGPGNYVVPTTVYWVGITAITIGGDTYTLPDPAAAGVKIGKRYFFKDQTGLAATRFITFNTAAGLIDGGATTILASNYGAFGFYTDGSNWFGT